MARQPQRWARADEEIINVDRIALARLEGATAERHETYLRDHAGSSARVDPIDANLIKSPEIECVSPVREWN